MGDRGDDGHESGPQQRTTPSPQPSAQQQSIASFLNTGSGGGGGASGGASGSGGGGDGRGPEPQASAPQETDVQKLQFPAQVPADVKAAVLVYRPPDGYAISAIHNVKGNPSFISFWGVRIHTTHTTSAGTKKRKNFYKCMANHTCRSSVKLLALTGSTTGATEHLKKVHEIESPSSADDKKKKQETLDKIDQVKQSKIYNSDKARHNMLGFTKAFVVYSACSFRLVEQEPIRHCLGVMVPKDELEPNRLNNKSVLDTARRCLLKKEIAFGDTCRYPMVWINVAAHTVINSYHRRKQGAAKHLGRLLCVQ
ncbi:unnamed protein product [Ectocarpus sp. CCAP 1310/34]|nr:unnamed protein product [Ectocarpus sp. CCAP 1310/34]